MPCFDCSPPVLVFWLWPWPKPGLIRRVMSRPGRHLAELVDHVGRAAVDVDVVLQHQSQRLGVEDVGRVDDRRRMAAGRVAGGQRAADFAGADRIDQHAAGGAPDREWPGSSRPSGRSGPRRRPPDRRRARGSSRRRRRTWACQIARPARAPTRRQFRSETGGPQKIQSTWFPAQS